MPQHHVFEGGLDFLERNGRRDGWFLQIETFDPHEPFFVPQSFQALYEDSYAGPHFDWPPYGRVTEAGDTVRHIRVLNAALVSMCDHYLGQILNLMDDLKLWDDTLLIVCTDHGFLLGEHDWWAKNNMPMWNQAHDAAVCGDSRSAGRRAPPTGAMIDFPATLLSTSLALSPCRVSPARRDADNAPSRAAILFGLRRRSQHDCGRYVHTRQPRRQHAPLLKSTHDADAHGDPLPTTNAQTWEQAGPFSFTKGRSVMPD
jgi:arylsulfatase A-like enzyme